MKKAIAMMMILALALSLMGVASAETQRVSKPFRIPRVLRHVESTVEPEAPAAEPTEEPAAEPTEAPAEEPAAEPAEEPVVEPTEAPAEEPTEAPAEEPAAAITARGDADVRVAADGLSEIFATLPDGTVLNLLAVEGDWAKVDVDGQIGYIYKDSVSGVEWPQTEPTEAIDEENMKVTIFTSRRTVVEPGETITLTSRLEGFENCEIIVYQWQYDRGNGFEDIPGADADTYAFAADVETLSYDWRLVVYYA